MEIPVSRTKITVPRRKGDLLSRERLLDLLYNFLDYKLIIVSAPAGYGKTSLLIDLAHQCVLPVCWYALDSLDRDPQRFFTHFIASIAQRFPSFGKGLASITKAMQQGDFNLDRLIPYVVNEACDQIREHFIIVLDDYHLVDDSQEVNAFVNRFIQNVDENCHVVILSRSLLPFSDLPLIVARSQVGGLGLQELAFRADEIQALMLQNHNLTIPKKTAEELAQETEGWITGLLLSAQTIWQGMTDRVRLARVSGVGLYDYLVQQVLDLQTPQVQDFLLRTSFLEEFDANLCENVFGSPPAGTSWSKLIEKVLRANLFVVPVGDKGIWLRYHHLFRDFLQSRLSQVDPEEKDRILNRLATISIQRGDWEKAHSIYQRLGDIPAIADLIEKAGSEMVKSSRLSTLAEWLDALPPEILAARPALLARRGIVAAFRGEVTRGLDLLNRAESAFRAAGNLPRLVGTLVWRASVYLWQANYVASLADADETLRLVGEIENPEETRAEALRIRGLALWRIGRLDKAIQCLEESLASFEASGDRQSVARLSVGLGGAYLSAGKYRDALVRYGQALDYYRQGHNAFALPGVLNDLGYVHHLRGEYEQASILLEEALVRARQVGHIRLEAMALTSLGDLYAQLDVLDAAQDAYSQARGKAPDTSDQYLILYINVADAALARRRKDIPRARQLLEAAEQLALKSGSSFEKGLCQLESGRLMLATGELQQASAQLTEAIHIFQHGGQNAEAARAYLYLAAACHAARDERAAYAHLAEAFGKANLLEGQHTLLPAGREARTLLEAASQAPNIGDQATLLLEQINRFEQGLPALHRQLRKRITAVPLTPPHLRFQALGKIQVSVGGKPVTSTDWRSQTSRDLFFLLLAHPEGLTKEAVGEIFWNDSSPAQLKLRFKNVLYRLRHALQQEVILYREEQYTFNHDLDYEYDVESFRSSLEKAEKAQEIEEKKKALKTAIKAYKGEYLPGMDGIWVLPEREQLRQAYLNASLSLAEIYLDEGEYTQAKEECQHILSEDPTSEETYRLAMRTCAAMGDRAAVAHHFENCQQALAEDIGIAPSPQTTALYESLMR